MESLVCSRTIHAEMNSARINQIHGVAIAAMIAIAAASAEQNAIVINEIMYHPPDDLESLQYIELYNAGKIECDLSGWHFSKGVKFAFPKGATLAPNGY